MRPPGQLWKRGSSDAYNYLQISGYNKGVALAAAAVVGLAILSDRDKWPRATFWLASLMAITISYMTYGTGVLLNNDRSNVLDSIFPLAMGLVEFTLFAILLSDETKTPHLWRNWFLVIFAHAGLAVLLVANRISQTFVNEDFEPALRPLANLYVGWLRADQLGATLVALISLGCWALMTFAVWPRWPHRAVLIQSVLAFLLACGMLVPILQADKHRQEMDQFISSLVRQKPNL
jgi:hypothetical protein